MIEIIGANFDVSNGLTCDISFKAEKNGSYGILCPDDTLKSALADAICGVKDVDGGEILINKSKMSRKARELKKKVRLVSSALVSDGMLTVIEYLDFVGNALGIDSERKYRQIKEAMELMGLDKQQSKPIFSLTAAQKCSLGIAAALIGNPEIIVFDEPFDDIPKSMAEEIYQVIDMLSDMKILILMLHEPEMVTRLCDEVAIIGNGRVLLCEGCEELEQKINATNTLNITVRGDESAVLEAIERVSGVVGVRLLTTDKNKVHTLSVEHSADTKMKDKLFEALSAINSPMLSYKEIRLSLADVYYSLTLSDPKNQSKESDQ